MGFEGGWESVSIVSFLWVKEKEYLCQLNFTRVDCGSLWSFEQAF